MDRAAAIDNMLFIQKQVDYWQAQLLRQLADFAIGTADDEFAAAEIVAAMKWTSKWAEDQLLVARETVTKLPRTVDALQAGEIDSYKAKILFNYTHRLTADQAAEVEERALVKAPGQTSTQLRRSLQRIVMAVDPEGCAERREARKAERIAGIEERVDDMVKLFAWLPADRGIAAAHRVDKLARAAKFPGDTRTLSQRRADVVADMLLATPDQTSSVKVNLNVTVSSTTLMGLDDHPGELVGYGPISAELARELAGDSTWRRLLTDPQSGMLLDVGTSTYRPPEHLRRFLWARDQTCRQPGCMMPAQRCELDHTVPYPDGPTAACNLCPFCKHHHRLKHKSNWAVTQPIPGRFIFKAPSGKVYVREPEPVLAGFPTDPPF
ncbi:hypothetical protein Lesp02_74250 [Lentzea sp. NBRC 105346]|uniref:HNH endonuclease signature motif containing protein n=1 Tax=Lentzea sp. NBRC 105346 TaxID=3032205 RepID=UPI0024A52056|nr:HNH endonuclease signature motif containing protein [Lentzea sp. NBRC 105346]GLZ35238.1 hypothetical protein Lesp02_74250 [Lentzea sp. NBRC 105346]